MLAQMYQAGMPKNYEEGVMRTKASRSAQEGFAFIGEATQIKFAVLTNCDLQTVGNEFSRKPMALVVQQNSTLKDRLSSAILKLLNERTLESLKEKHWDPFRRWCEDTKKSSDGISIHNIGGVFIVIFIGVVLSCITLVFEYLFLRRKKKNNQTPVTNMTTNPNGQQMPQNSYNHLFNGGTAPLAASTANGLSGLSGAPIAPPAARLNFGE
jgi:ionotropic glutamate receptor